MIVDCDSCEVRGDACGECVISVLLGAPPSVELDSSEQQAIDALASAGMVPRLRLVSEATRPGGDAPKIDTPARNEKSAERSKLGDERRWTQVS
ncbi:hypothetical protein EV193_104115 [Herbihabitans rhizosphaerae]|uniref:Uncharacterized protein n=1 Tax=Herbihabitans rhizosphaerae TaxID=1872711 RepID=A0A4Q7KR02_9PSEU|nr:hypothetical protein [Herbihabitans rhizosphaerae]RZS38904.1 hypothetical protein EV193_104115 [Herbihabitans rhizosphaerae]